MWLRKKNPRFWCCSSELESMLSSTRGKGRKKGEVKTG